MTPVEICDPLFRYICRLNRSVNAGVSPPMTRVRSEVIQILDDIAQLANANAELRSQFDDQSEGKLNQLLVYFVDSIIAESDYPFAMDWQRIELDRYGEQVGDERFWMHLEDTLKDPSPQAEERLAVYYQCIGLGFTGLYFGQPEYLRSKMNQIAERLSRKIRATDNSGAICPEAYQHTDRSDLIEPPAPRMIGIAIAVAGLVITLFIANVYLYHQAKSDVADALEIINTKSPGGKK